MTLGASSSVTRQHPGRGPLQFRAALLEIEPEIWRRLLVPSSRTRATKSTMNTARGSAAISTPSGLTRPALRFDNPRVRWRKAFGGRPEPGE